MASSSGSPTGVHVDSQPRNPVHRPLNAALVIVDGIGIQPVEPDTTNGLCLVKDADANRPITPSFMVHPAAFAGPSCPRPLPRQPSSGLCTMFTSPAATPRGCLALARIGLPQQCCTAGPERPTTILYLQAHIHGYNPCTVTSSQNPLSPRRRQNRRLHPTRRNQQARQHEDQKTE